MKNILITGGPVHAHLDAVKIITNNFKGGRMAELASKLHSLTRHSSYVEDKFNIIYLCTKDSFNPEFTDEGMKVIHHNGYDNYRDIVLDLAPVMDAVILGAAVSNLIPQNPWKGKFPSHNYKEGDVIHIPFVVAPRIINMVKSVAKPSCHLFGFKLLKNVEHEELINAAYEIVLDAHATCVFANDRNELDTKYAVTKERGVHPLTSDNYAQFIIDRINDKYYSTKLFKYDFSEHSADLIKAKSLANENKNRFKKVGQHMFGTIAWRTGDVEFITTGRGKNELDSWTYVKDVCHNSNVVTSGPIKASLNAPLLHYIFVNNPDVIGIIHAHEHNPNLPQLPYAPPGTVTDSIRDVKDSFEINGHGIFELIKEKTL